MSFFRSPLYLDLEVLVPLANYHDIEVMTDLEVTQRDRGNRSFGGEAGAAVSIVPGAPSIKFRAGKGNESEVTQTRSVKDHPTDSLNRLVDKLQKDELLTTDLAQAVAKRQLVEVERAWGISQATDVGSLLTGLFAFIARDPSILARKEPPDELFDLMTSPGQAGGAVVLDSAEGDTAEDVRVLTLLDAGGLVGNHGLDDLEGEMAVFGQVEALMSDTQSYSLERFLLSGVSRTFRRSISVNDLLAGFGKLGGRNFTSDDLQIKGPLVVIKGIAIY